MWDGCRAQSHQLIQPSRIFVVLSVIVIFAGCASSASRLKSGDCGRLTPLPDTGTTRVCVHDELPPEGYAKAKLDRLRIEARTVGSSSSTFVGRSPGTIYPVGPEQKKLLAQLTEEMFASALAGVQLERADEEGMGVLLVRGRFLDLFFEVPSDPNSGASYLLARRARATLVVELIDSQSGTLLLRAYDERSTESSGTDADSQIRQLREIASLWGAMLVESIGQLRTLDGPLDPELR
jgi:hypothetical protein